MGFIETSNRTPAHSCPAKLSHVQERGLGDCLFWIFQQ